MGYLNEGMWLLPGEAQMSPVMAPMTGVTVGAVNSQAVAPRTSGLGNKRVLPVFGNTDDKKKKKYNKKHHTEWLSRGNLRLIEAEMDDKEPLGLDGQARRSTDEPEDPAEAKIRDWHTKFNLPWHGAKVKPLSSKTITAAKTPSELGSQVRKLRSIKKMKF
jgi:hypothetical protein